MTRTETVILLLWSVWLGVVIGTVGYMIGASFGQVLLMAGVGSAVLIFAEELWQNRRRSR